MATIAPTVKQPPVWRPGSRAIFRERATQHEVHLATIFARHGITREEAVAMSDDDLLALENLGRTRLAYLRAYPQRPVWVRLPAWLR
jgi:hypothetical protein